ncbi:M15 family metallopeptidase [Paenibacillus sp. HB172176]|uniref:M15 family metallopeptidase n=1 Tax=Paenibacillus sp. HB172176 TaxID=2493690 RepID=UPI00143B2356|nr:M15 family metallopeptidase [Paenibacillus sp. HB172176]
MKKWGLALSLILLVGCHAFDSSNNAAIQTRSGSTSTNTQGQTNNTASSVAPTKPGTGTQNNTERIKIEEEQIFRGNLVLVNQQFPVHEVGVRQDIVKVNRHLDTYPGLALYDATIRMSLEVLGQYAAMVDAAGSDNVNHFMITSGYRDEEEQTALFEQQGDAYALPAGHSEHNLGMSLDIGSTLMEMEHAPEGKWLKEHAADYGFILRYPPNKFSVTGIRYEPWHFRYVGLPHSKIMKELNLTLEEYLDKLKDKKSLTVEVDGRSYDIRYVPVTGSATVELPEEHDYTISGNNSDGVIVTISLSQA